jgi:hypothetical protein
MSAPQELQLHQPVAQVDQSAVERLGRPRQPESTRPRTGVAFALAGPSCFPLDQLGRHAGRHVARAEGAGLKTRTRGMGGTRSPNGSGQRPHHVDPALRHDWRKRASMARIVSLITQPTFGSPCAVGVNPRSQLLERRLLTPVRTRRKGLMRMDPMIPTGFRRQGVTFRSRTALAPSGAPATMVPARLQRPRMTLPQAQSCVEPPRSAPRRRFAPGRRPRQPEAAIADLRHCSSVSGSKSQAPALRSTVDGPVATGAYAGGDARLKLDSGVGEVT